MASKIRFRQLECFRAIASTGSFEKAAKLLGVTAPAVHQHVANLQATVEGPPFFGDKLYEVEDGHHLRITPYGNDFLLLADAVVSPLEQFEAKSRNQTSKSITLACAEPICSYALPIIIKKFTETGTGLLLRIRSHLQEETISLVSAGEAHIGIVQKGDFAGDLVFKEWRRFDTVLMAPLNSPFLTGPLTSLPNLAHERLILYTARGPASSIIWQKLREAGAKSSIMETTSFECAKRCVAMGLGIAFASAIGITEEDKKYIKVVPVSRIVGEYIYGVIFRRKTSLPSTLSLVLDAMGIKLDKFSK